MEMEVEWVLNARAYDMLSTYLQKMQWTYNIID